MSTTAAAFWPDDRGLTPDTRSAARLSRRWTGPGELDSQRLAQAALVVLLRTVATPPASVALPDDSVWSLDPSPDLRWRDVDSRVQRSDEPGRAGSAMLRISDRPGGTCPPDQTVLFLGGQDPAALASQSGQGFHGQQLTLQVDPHRVSAMTASDFLDKLELALDALLQQPDSRCEDTVLIGATAHRVLPDLSQPIQPETHPGVAQRFFEVARRHAAEPAIVGEQDVYCYGELARAVSHLAGGLIADGLRPGEVVAVHGASSFGMLASMLAVLAAGGVLVTLDSALPDDRQRLITEISQARHHIHVVTARTGRDAAAPQGLVIPAWPTREELDAWPEPGFEPIPLPDDAAAYLFFTSGSTGTPKGVLGSHRGLAHFLDWQRSEFGIGPGDRTAQLTALSFDVVLRDVLFPLTSGACVHIPTRERVLDARRMLRWIESSHITAMHCVPSLMKAWLQACGDDRPLRSLRTIFFAGEPLTDALLQRFRAASGEQTLIVNLYGPTETTLAKLSHRIDRIEPGVQPVGRPQPGVDVVILRNRRTPCGLWETGEIAIRTPYRSHGYHGRPELTLEVFVPNPWRDDPADLIYFTGDLGRWRPDGKVEIFGRIDSQIKIRGVRIEPNEIESQMLRVPGVRDAAVAVRSAAHGDKQLIGFLVASDDGQSSARDLAQQVREQLRDRLQDAMVPARFVVLPQLPYLPNGKIDRKSLTALAHSTAEAAPAAADRARPELPAAARQLLAALENILGAPIESLDDSFITLGGDSLSYVRASVLVEDALGRLPAQWERLPLSALIEPLQREQRKPQATGLWSRLTRTSSMESALLFRALAIMVVIFSHLPMAWNLPSSTPVLFAIAGLNFQRFLLPATEISGQLWPSVRFVLKFAIPAGLWNLMLGLKNHNLWWPDMVLLGSAFQQPGHPGWKLWFLDVLAANVLLMAIMVAAARLLRGPSPVSPAPRGPGSGAGRTPWGWIWLAVGLAISLFHDLTQWWNGPLAEAGISPFKWLWMLGVGVIIADADTARKKWGVTAAVAAMAALKYAGPPVLQQSFALVDWLFYVSLVALVWVDRVRLPFWLTRPLTVIAAATLFIFITNLQSIYGLAPRLGIPPSAPALLVFTLAVGVGAHLAWNAMTQGLSRLWSRWFKRRAEQPRAWLESRASR